MKQKKNRMIRAVTVLMLLSILTVTSETAVAATIPAGISKVFSEALSKALKTDVPETACAGISREISEALRKASEKSNIPEEREATATAGISRAISNALASPTVSIATEETVKSANPAEATEAEVAEENTITLMYSSEELEYISAILSKTLHGEATGCGIPELYRVGTVVMNRVKRPDFPNTIEGVLREGYECYHNEIWYNEEPTEEERRVAEDIVYNGTRVFDITVVYQAQHKQGTVVYLSECGHYYGAKPLPEE